MRLDRLLNQKYLWRKIHRLFDHFSILITRFIKILLLSFWITASFAQDLSAITNKLSFKIPLPATLTMVPPHETIDLPGRQTPFLSDEDNVIKMESHVRHNADLGHVGLFYNKLLIEKGNELLRRSGLLWIPRWQVDRTAKRSFQPLVLPALEIYNSKALFAKLSSLWKDGRLIRVVKYWVNSNVLISHLISLFNVSFSPIKLEWWATAIIVLIAVTVVWYLTRLYYIRALAEKDKALQQFRSKIYSEVTDEISTHLALISTPIEDLIRNQSVNENTHRQLMHVKTHVDSLAKLISEMMDLQKAESNDIFLQVNENDIVYFLNDIFLGFKDIADQKQISFTYSAPEYPVLLYFDRTQLKKVMFNLLNNAFHFTMEAGMICLKLEEQADSVVITVMDNGKSIESEILKTIFVKNPQFTGNRSSEERGGVGLVVTKKLVELHKGRLSATSLPSVNDNHQGNTCFQIVLLKGNAHFQSVQLSSLETTTHFPPILTVAERKGSGTDQEDEGKPVILVVEDNYDLRNFLKESLQIQFKVMECMTGSEGLELATEFIPDLIISDVMMPHMDGYTLCSLVKKDERTSHIPVILLTAKTSQENQLEGLYMGADSYITKPFSFQILELQVRNLIASRQTLRQKFSQQIFLEPKKVEINVVDEAFINKIMTIIENHIDDPDFGVSLLASEIGMSQPVLYKKLKALTDMTVNNFIKSIRLKKAQQLLNQQQLTVAEVAYSVGFSRREHFSIEFRKQFGKTPTDYQKDHVDQGIEKTQ